MPVTPEDVVKLYHSLLGRAPESQAVIDLHTTAESVMQLVRGLTDSDEFKARSSRFNYFDANFDAVAIARKFEDPNRQPVEGHRVNYYGVAIRDDIVPRHALDITPKVERDPLPANWHADTAEFAAVLRTIDRALERGQTNYTMVELGCGWGCWMNIAGKVAQRHGLEVQLVGIEGDIKNFSLAEHTLKVNGFACDHYTLIHGIAAASGSSALFYQQTEEEESWGIAPMFDFEDGYKEALESERYAELPVVTFEQLKRDHGYIDLLHVDIQGGERDLIPSIIDQLDDAVGHVMMASHSRQIEGEMHDIFISHGWTLDLERPAVLLLNHQPPIVSVDGVQAWTNLRLVG